MAPDVVARVFEPFFSTKRESGGTGLGLSMVRAFAEQASGCVSIDSEPGRGTTVRIDLPLCIDGVEDSAARTMPLSTLPTGDEKVLLLAREEGLRTTVSQILEVLGYSVTLVADLEPTCAALTADAPRILIVDGCFADDLKQLQPRLVASAPSIVLAAGVEHPLGPLSMVLRKPFSLADLAGAVRSTLDRKIRPTDTRSE
jgi:CheY-like chemotaxis protein